jgi:EpsI family protein
MLVITVQPFQRTLAERGWIFVILTAVLLAPVLYLQRRGGFSIATATLARAQGGFLAPGPLAVLLAGAVVLAAGPVWSTTSASPASGASAASPQLPDVADCSADSGAFEAWSKPSVKNTDFVVERTYACSGQPVRVFVAGYSNSTQGREFGNGIAQIMPMEQSVTVEQRTTFARADGRVTKVAEVQVERAPAEQYLIWYWFALGDGTATTGAGAKLAQAYQLIAHGRSDARLYVLATPAAEDATEARRVLSTVSAAVYAAIESSAAESVVQPDRS